jgi:hypothetical protein
MRPSRECSFANIDVMRKPLRTKNPLTATQESGIVWKFKWKMTMGATKKARSPVRDGRFPRENRDAVATVERPSAPASAVRTGRGESADCAATED